MKNAKRELLNDVLTGLLVAAILSAGIPVDALAASSGGDLAAVGTGAENGIMVPFVQFASYAAYAIGTIMVVSGVMTCKKHADQPANNPLGPGLGKLAAGGALLIAPTFAGMLTGTANNIGVSGTTSFSTFGGVTQ